MSTNSISSLKSSPYVDVMDISAKRITKSRKSEKTNLSDFDNLRRIADVFVSTFGKFCEVVIHDFSNLKHSVVYIAGNVTKRKIGSPVTDLVLREWKSEGDKVEDLANYKTFTKNGRALKSSTIFLRNERGKIAGAFCINFDITEFLEAGSLIREFSNVAEFGKENGKAETFAVSVDETIDSLIEQTIDQIGKQPPNMQMNDKISFVDILDKKGAFLIKGAVSHIAALLGVSKFTIYNYLQRAKAREKINAL